MITRNYENCDSYEVATEFISWNIIYDNIRVNKLELLTILLKMCNTKVQILSGFKIELNPFQPHLKLNTFS